jgi:hypothetical protein
MSQLPHTNPKPNSEFSVVQTLKHIQVNIWPLLCSPWELVHRGIGINVL